MLFSSLSQRLYKPASCSFAWLAVVGCCCVMAVPTLIAGSPGTNTRSVAEKEMARRQALQQDAKALLNEGSLHAGQGNYVEAMRLYRQAWDSLPDAPLTAELRRQARDGYSSAAVHQAKKYAALAQYPEARALLQSVLAEDFNPDYEEAKKFSAQLDDPERYEPALTPAHLANAEQAMVLLQKAYSFLNLADYDSAIGTFKDVLRIDPYNSAARRGMEQAEMHRASYYNQARDQMRTKALSEVDKMWEAPLADVSGLFGGSSVTMGAIVSSKDTIVSKLRSIIIPRVDLQGASLEEVVQFLRIRSRDLDPDKKGVDFVLKVPQEDRNKPITLSLVEVPIEEVLRYATESTGTVFRLDEFAVTINSLSERDATIVSKSYRVPPDFIQNAAMDSAAPGTSPDPFGQASSNNNQILRFRRLGAREFLEQRGIQFPENTSASYNASTNILFVRNTLDNIALVDTIVEQAVSTTPKQVEIQVRMMEVNETRLNELGFDWLLGQFNTPGSEKLFASGGTAGNQRPSGNFSTSEFPIGLPSGSPVGANPVTSGLRSSGNINGLPSVDTLLGRVNVTPIDSRSPGQFAVSGVFTDPQFQLVIRSLSQKKGLDVVASPTVVTKSGMRSSISVVREFRYPTEFDPPQIPQSLGTVDADGDGFTDGGTDFAPITPTTPTTFEKRDVGVILEVEPVISADNRTVDLNLIPSSTEFEGFIDYGTDITNTAPGPGGSRIPYVIDNDILQPVFRTNKVNTSVVVWDGQTVVLGGVMYEKMSEINDKVPVLGDIPIVGRAFKSKVKSVERKNVIFFVTVKVIDPGGNRVLPVGESTAAR